MEKAKKMMHWGWGLILIAVILGFFDILNLLGGVFCFTVDCRFESQNTLSLFVHYSLYIVPIFGVIGLVLLILGALDYKKAKKLNSTVR